MSPYRQQDRNYAPISFGDSRPNILLLSALVLVVVGALMGLSDVIFGASVPWVLMALVAVGVLSLGVLSWRLKERACRVVVGGASIEVHIGSSVDSVEFADVVKVRVERGGTLDSSSRGKVEFVVQEDGVPSRIVEVSSNQLDPGTFDELCSWAESLAASGGPRMVPKRDP